MATTPIGSIISKSSTTKPVKAGSRTVEPESTVSTTTESEIAKPRSKIVVSSKHKPMSNWTLKELKILHTEIKNGNNSIKGLQEKILSKTEQELMAALSYCSELVSQISREKPVVVKKYKKEYKETITKWLDLMAECNNIHELTSVVYSDALIEMSKNVSPADECEGVDFTKILIYVVKTLRGELLPSLNNTSHYVFNQALRKAILCAKRELKYNENLITHLKSLSSETLPKMTGNSFLQCNELTDLISNDEYNPLKIPINCLNSSSKIFYSDDDDDDDE